MSGIFDTSVVTDFDTPFVIDAETREITNKKLTKRTLIQNDHNSERFGFEIPRFIEGRDVALCNVVQVIYVNTDARTKKQNTGVYTVEDLKVYPFVNDVLICSWLISQNATKYEGNLSFMLRFANIEDDGLIKYAWSTKAFEDVYVVGNLDNSEIFESDYVDVIQQWKNSVMEELLIYTDVAIKEHINVAQIDVNKNDISMLTNEQDILKSRMDTFASLPEGSTSANAELQDIRVGADGKTYSTAGEAVREQFADIRRDIGNVAQIDVNKKDISMLTNEQDILKSRMDTFASLPEGSTAANAELQDIRVGADGKTYSTAGEAVREQFADIRRDIGNGSNEIGDINSIELNDIKTNKKYKLVVADGKLTMTEVAE